MTVTEMERGNVKSYPDDRVDEISRWIQAAEKAARKAGRLYSAKASPDSRAAVRGHFENAAALLRHALEVAEKAAKILDPTPDDYHD